MRSGVVKTGMPGPALGPLIKGPHGGL